MVTVYAIRVELISQIPIATLRWLAMRLLFRLMKNGIYAILENSLIRKTPVKESREELEDGLSEFMLQGELEKLYNEKGVLGVAEVIQEALPFDAFKALAKELDI